MYVSSHGCCVVFNKGLSINLYNKLTLDLPRYIQKSLLGDTSYSNFSLIVPEISKMWKLMKLFETWRK